MSNLEVSGNIKINKNAVFNNLISEQASLGNDGLVANQNNVSFGVDTFISPAVNLFRGISGGTSNKNYVYSEDEGDGFFRRSDGIQVCYSRFAKNGHGPFTVNLPKPFVNSEYQILTQQLRTTGQGSYTNTQNVVSTTITTTSFQIGTDYSESGNVMWVALGRWK